MKVFNQLGPAFIILAAASSCTTLSHEATTAAVDTKIVSMTVGDMKVSKEKASATAEWKWTPFTAVKPGEIQLAATAKLLRETNADVIVEPTAEIKRRGLFRGGSVTVTGYPATYTGFHPMTETEAKAYAATRLCPTATATYVAPAGKTQPAKPARVRKERRPFNNGSFFDATIGVTTADDYTSGTFGFTYGHYCKNRWGWYARLNLDWGAGFSDMEQHVKNRTWIDGFYDENYYWHDGRYENEYCTSGHRSYGGSAGAGVLYGFSNTFGIFAGAGIGVGITNYYDTLSNFNHPCEGHDCHFGEVRAVAPVEIGINLRFDALNVMAGYRCSVCLEDDFGQSPSTFFLGLGLNF